MNPIQQLLENQGRIQELWPAMMAEMHELVSNQGRINASEAQMRLKSLPLADATLLVGLHSYLEEHTGSSLVGKLKEYQIGFHDDMSLEMSTEVLDIGFNIIQNLEERQLTIAYSLGILVLCERTLREANKKIEKDN